MHINKKFHPISLSLLLAGSVATLPLAAGSKEKSADHSAAMGEDRNEYLEEDVREAWMEGKLESAFLLNRHLNNFTIDPEVNGTEVVLKGSVSSDVDRDLAEEIALDVDGIEKVSNELEVSGQSASDKVEDSAESFASRVEDATLTAEVKMKLLANSNTEGLNINVDTEGRVVTLEGQVDTDANRDLAGKIAGNVDGVSEVVNKLEVRS